MTIPRLADAAIAAINDGQIFRFLCKPCPENTLKSSLQAAVRQFELVTAERQLLENTLNGAVEALTDTSSLAAPQAFQRSSALQRMVKHMYDQLKVGHWWQLNMAALLAPIGCITLPTDVVARAYSGLPLSEVERQMVQRHPEAGRLLIQGIPRLEPVAEMIGAQMGVCPPMPVTTSPWAPRCFGVACTAAQPWVDTNPALAATR
jgi:response regulator RpfG family c-di-GMP phosphodiesterase